MESKQMNFYQAFAIRYNEADQAIKQASKAHWIKCNRENVLQKRNDLIMFTAKVLAIIEQIDTNGLSGDYFASL